MARAYSQDLRDRVIDAALGGMPARRAAAQFEIGVATAIEAGGKAPSVALDDFATVMSGALIEF